jgi:hypothetical protein
MGLFDGILNRFKWYNYPAGNLLSEEGEIQGIYGGFLQWRIKQTNDGDNRFVSLRLKPSFYYGAEGNPNCFVDLDLDAARRVRDSLNEVIRDLESLG